jgi:hypothetical protein
MGTVRFTTSGGSPRLSRASAGLPAPTACTVIYRMRVAAYSAGLTRIWALTNAGESSFQTGLLVSDGLWMETSEGGYANNQIWTDSYAGWAHVAWTFAAGAGNHKSFYHRDGGSFVTGVTLTGTTFTQSSAFINAWPPDGGDAATVDYAVLKIWSAVLNTTEIQTEFASRAAVRTSNLYFYNACTNAATVGTDGSGSGNDFTITGTPTAQSDDPWGGGAASPPMGGSRNLLTGRLPHLRMRPSEAEAAQAVRASKRPSGRAFAFPELSL